VARAQQASARAQLAANAEQGTEVVQAQAQVALAGSATAAAQARLAQAVLTAPADARVLARLVEPGQIVQPGHALLSLALAGPLQLVAQVDERYLEQLQVGQTASVLADAFPGQRFSARVLSISPLVDAKRGAIEVKFSLPEAPPVFLREDMTLSVEVETARRQAALVVPVDALRGDQAVTDAVVLVARDGRVEERAGARRPAHARSGRGPRRAERRRDGPARQHAPAGQPCARRDCRLDDPGCRLARPAQRHA
jgi:HlyD family secretion protein